jgi:hypothetical protein
MNDIKDILASAAFVGRWYWLVVVCSLITLVLGLLFIISRETTIVAENVTCEMTDMKPNGDILRVYVDCHTSTGIIKGLADSANDKYLFIKNPMSRLTCSINGAKLAQHCVLPSTE